MGPMDTHRVPDAGGERFGRIVGATLITEGVLVAILRFLSLVYVVASEAYNADRFRTPLSHYLPSVVITTVASIVLVWAGSFLRREPTGAWAEVGLNGRIALVAACLLNLAALATAVSGLIRSPATVEGALAWIAIAVLSVVVIAGLVRDVMRSRAAYEPGTAG
jgi:predicted transporter